MVRLFRHLQPDQRCLAFLYHPLSLSLSPSAPADCSDCSGCSVDVLSRVLTSAHATGSGSRHNRLALTCSNRCNPLLSTNIWVVRRFGQLALTNCRRGAKRTCRTHLKMFQTCETIVSSHWFLDVGVVVVGANASTAPSKVPSSAVWSFSLHCVTQVTTQEILASE